MPSVEKTIFEKKMEEYLQSTKAAHRHAGKLIAFSELMKAIFGITSFEIVQNVEEYVKTGGIMVLKGRMDLHLGQTILEFKIDLDKELETGKRKSKGTLLS
jgi:glycine/serine hydroxymethyltransferase